MREAAASLPRYFAGCLVISGLAACSHATLGAAPSDGHGSAIVLDERLVRVGEHTARVSQVSVLAASPGSDGSVITFRHDLQIRPPADGTLPPDDPALAHAMARRACPGLPAATVESTSPITAQDGSYRLEGLTCHRTAPNPDPI